MKRLFFLLLVIILAACNAPKPAPSITPAVSSSRIPSSAPSPTSISPASKPSPVPSANAPTNEPTRVPERPALDSSLLPSVEKTLDLGQALFADFYVPVPLALDAQADRLYVSLSPSRTVVLDANTLTSVGEIPYGGALSVNSSMQRLYVGVPGSYSYNPDGTTVITPAELKLFDTSNLGLLRSVILSDTSTIPPLVTVDSVHNKAYLTQNGITIVEATTLEVQGTLSGTFPVPNAPVPNYSAVEAAIDPQRQRLFVSLNNGVPGSNGGTVLYVYDLATGRVVNQDFERSVVNMVLDPQTGDALVPQAYMTTAAIKKYDTRGNLLKRLDGLSGFVQIDPQRDRVYILDETGGWRLKVLDRDLNFLGMVDLPADVVPQGFIVDTEHDRLLILQRAGQLLVLKGHAQPTGLQSAVNAIPSDRYAVFFVQPAPLGDRLLASIATAEYATGGVLFHSNDAGATWQVALPLAVSDAHWTDQSMLAVTSYHGWVRGDGLWRSFDNGQTWRPASHGLTDLALSRLAVSPDVARDGTIFAVSPRGIFRSVDQGATWSSLADRYASLLKDYKVNFNSIALSPIFAQDNTLLVSHTSGLWRSTDRGETWTNIDNSPHATRLAYASDSSTVLAIDYDGVHRSDDGGLMWRLFNAGLDPSNITISDVQINDREAVVLVAGFGQPGAVYRLPLNGTTWQRVPIEADVTALALTLEGQLLIGTSAGMVQRVK